MNFKINKNTKIYVACPANVATGGPELLHQLVHKMNLFGINAKMFYYPNNIENPVHKFYKKYNNAFVREIEDDENNILIVPEVKTDLIYKYNKIKKIIWWLSVDNFTGYPKNVKKTIKIILKKITKPKSFYNFEDLPNLYHLVQSYYAKNYLLKKGIKKEKIDYLSDYLNPLFIEKQLKNKNKLQKENIVVYNPKKGYQFTKKIIKNAPDIKFVPIINMTPEEVADLLLKAKVYIDFGNHPGKDRIPREAAISNCCVIVGKRGSAQFKEDVPIDDEYKFDVKSKNISNIINKIRYLLDNYDYEIKKFENYRNFILAEEKNFEQDIKRIFVSEELEK
ncbi:hypothetical protein LN42_06455 [Marinitoga sp. 1137]|uniref:hypothetical protein n=1 Tax=Marinitoga sp. 1137 TaxID=1545835 RepID=UPI0009506C90|nr:hypothetical protein [Marinitoga sp. 1137]APT76061.1 hypothetical protein LN42_06455 [Marinitoga sp. 1137]